MSVLKCELIETNKYQLEIAVDAEQFAAATERVYKKQRGSIAVPGFRKGKAPRSVIEKMYGESIFFEDAVDELFPIAYEAAVLENNLEPVDRPEVNITSISAAEGFTFTAIVTVKPEVTVKDYKGIAVTRPSDAVSAEDVDAEINRLAERNARLVDVDDRAAEMGDTVNFDFEGFMDGTPFEGGKADGHQMVLGSHQFIEGFEEQIVGHSIGDEFEVNVTFPEEYHAEELAGKPAVFKCKLNQIKIKEMPVIDDEFAKDLGDYETLAELREKTEARLAEGRKRNADNAVENQLIDKVIENMEAEIPQCMIENKIDEMVRDFGYRLQMQGIDLDTYYKYTGSDEATFRKTFAAQSEKQVQIRLALEKIAELEQIQCTEEELDEEYKKMAEQYRTEEARIRAAIPVMDLEKDLCVNKAIEIIQASAVITPETEEAAAE